MSFFDGVMTNVWAHMCRLLPGLAQMQASREFQLIGAAEFAVWGRAMEEAGPGIFAPNLDHLIFYNMQMHGEPIECLSRKFARGDWQMLERFEVANGGLGDDGMVLLAGALQSSPHLFPNLPELMFYGNEVGPRGIKALAKALQQGACPCLESLNINANPIRDEGLVALWKPCRPERRVMRS